MRRVRNLYPHTPHTLAMQASSVSLVACNTITPLLSLKAVIRLPEPTTRGRGARGPSQGATDGAAVLRGAG